MKINKDVLLGGLAGFLIGLLALPIFQNLGHGLSLASGIGMAVALALITMAGVILVGILSSFLPALNQLARFVVVGGLNTLVVLGIFDKCRHSQLGSQLRPLLGAGTGRRGKY